MAEPFFDFVGGPTGQAFTPDEFIVYALGYDYGAIPPDSWCWHHTAIPDASWATTAKNPKTYWDRDEQDMDDEQIKVKRLKQLVGVRNFYRDTMHWQQGPHLFVDDKFIYPFTNMRSIGIHCKWGNSFHSGDGKLHYSVGCEMIGDYSRVQWPAAVQYNAGIAVAAVKKATGTFELTYLYPDPARKPGRATRRNTAGELVEYCPHPEYLRWGGMFSHRDTNKPACPGAAISESFYVSVAQAGWAALTNPTGRETLAGPERRIYQVSSGVAKFYQDHGGLLTFGYPLGNEFELLDEQNEKCGWVVCEFAVIKRKPSQPAPWTVRLAPRDEAAVIYKNWQVTQSTMTAG